MEQKDSKIFSKEMMQAVSAFCESKEIKDVDNFIYLCFKQGFDIKKYGFLGKTINEGEKHLKTGGIEEKQVEIEVIREIRVEVPVEVIKEVEKIIYTTDDNQVNELLLKIQQLEIELFENSEQLNELLSKIEHLNGEISIKSTEIDNIRQEFSIKTKEMENIFQNEMSKKDNELDELRHNLDISVDDGKLKMLQQTIQNLNSEIRDLKNKNKELEKKILEQPKNNSFINAKFHGSSNLNG
jgi:chromosome segregation ATPase